MTATTHLHPCRFERAGLARILQRLLEVARLREGERSVAEEQVVVGVQLQSFRVHFNRSSEVTALQRALAFVDQFLESRLHM